MDMQELTRQEVIEYYNAFYKADDFAYYSKSVSRRVLLALTGKARLARGARVLDLGCGTGFYSSIFQELGYLTTGVDISSTAISRAAVEHGGIPFFVGDATRLPFRSGSFDMIFSLGVSVMNTHDIDSLHNYVRHLMKLLAPGGVLLFIGGSDLSGNRARTSSWIYHKWEEILQFVPKGTWRSYGPYLSHFRLLSVLGGLALGRIMTFMLRRLPGGMVRRVVYIVKMPDNALQ